MNMDLSRDSLFILNVIHIFNFRKFLQKIPQISLLKDKTRFKTFLEMIHQDRMKKILTQIVRNR